MVDIIWSERSQQLTVECDLVALATASDGTVLVVPERHGESCWRQCKSLPHARRVKATRTVTGRDGLKS